MGTTIDEKIVGVLRRGPREARRLRAAVERAGFRVGSAEGWRRRLQRLVDAGEIVKLRAWHVSRRWPACSVLLVVYSLPDGD